jgi:hypothetical protein
MVSAVLLALLAQPTTVSGSVHARGTREPIHQALVEVEGLGEKAETDVTGAFTLPLQAGRYRLTVRASGYHPETFELEVVPGGKAQHPWFDLAPWGRFETTVHAGPRQSGSHTLNDEESHSVAGTGGDPFKALMLMPGVGTLTSGLSYPVVRGSNPAATGFFIDGIRIPQLYHSFLGPAVINPSFIERIEFLPGGADVRYGRVIGGVVDAKLRKPSTEGIHATAVVDAISANAWVDVPYSTGSVMMAGRVSYSGWLFGLMGDLLSRGQQVVANFADYQARFEQRVAGGTFRLLALGATDDFGLVADDPTESSIGPQTFGFHRVDARYRHAVGPGTLELGATLGVDDVLFRATGRVTDFAPLTVVKRQSTDIHQVSMGGRVGWSTSSGSWDVSTGVSVDHVSADWKQELKLEVLDNNMSFPFRISRPTAAGLWLGAFASARWTGVPRLKVTAGLRLDGFHEVATVGAAQPANARSGPNALAVDPRVSASFAVTTSLTVRAAAGLFHQAPTLLLPLPVADLTTSQTGFQEVLQLSAGSTWKIWRDLEVSVDLYMNPMLRLVEYPLMDDERATINALNPGSFSPADLQQPNISRGLAMGAEAMIRWPLGRRWFGWVSFAVQRSTRDEAYWLTNGTDFLTQTSGTLPYAFDQTFVANAALTFFFDHGWSVGVALHGNTGRPELGVLGSRTFVPNSDGTQWVFLDRSQVDRLPPYFRVDARIAKTWLTKYLTIEAFLDVLNATVRPEIISFDYDASGGALRKTAVGLPVVLPTIGVRVKY